MTSKTFGLEFIITQHSKYEKHEEEQNDKIELLGSSVKKDLHKFRSAIYAYRFINHKLLHNSKKYTKKSFRNPFLSKRYSKLGSKNKYLIWKIYHKINQLNNSFSNKIKSKSLSNSNKTRKK